METALRLSSKRFAYVHYFLRKCKCWLQTLFAFQRQTMFCSSVAILSRLCRCHLWKMGYQLKMDPILILRSFSHRISIALGQVIQCFQKVLIVFHSWMREATVLTGPSKQQKVFRNLSNVCLRTQSRLNGLTCRDRCVQGTGVCIFKVCPINWIYCFFLVYF